MFSKILVIGISILTVAISIFACVFIAVTGASDTLDVLITAIFAQMSIVAGFYFYKAKQENIIKLGGVYAKDAFLTGDRAGNGGFLHMDAGTAAETDLDEGRG